MRADGSDIYLVTYRDPKDRVNIFEELLTQVITKTLNFSFPNSSHIGDEWGVIRQTRPHRASSSGIDSMETFDHVLIKEDIDKRPQLRYP